MADESLRIIINAKNDTQGAFNSVNDNLKKLSKNLLNVSKKVAIVATGMTVFAIKTAADFESAFAGVRKTVDATEEQFAAMNQELKDLATQIPVSFESLSRIGELGGQLGVAQDEIVDFTEVIAKIAVTTNLTEEQAATSFARIANIMQIPMDQADEMGSTVVALGNNFATTESEIVEFSNRIAASGNLLGLTTPEIMGVATALTSVGIQAEAGGTSIQKTFNKINEAVITGSEELEVFAEIAGMTTDEFVNAVETDALGAFNAFIEGMEDAGPRGLLLLEELGLNNERVKTSLLSVAGAQGLMSEATEMANKSYEENNALTEEAEKRFATFHSQLKIVWNMVKNFADIIGQAFIPHLKDLAAWIQSNKDRIDEYGQRLAVMITEGLQRLINWIIENKEEIIAFGQNVINGVKDTIISLTDWFIKNKDTLLDFINNGIFIAVGALKTIGDAVNSVSEFLKEHKAALEAAKIMLLGFIGAKVMGSAISVISTFAGAVIGANTSLTLLKTGGWSIAIAGIGYVIERLYTAVEAARQLKIELGKFQSSQARGAKLVDKYTSSDDPRVREIGKELAEEQSRIARKYADSLKIGNILGDMVPSFDTGGVVPGPTGSPQLVMAHGGETILPTHKGGGGQIVININGSVYDKRGFEQVLEKTLVPMIKNNIKYSR